MKSQTSQHRPYQEVGALIRDLIVKTPYRPGDRLPPEREIAEMLAISVKTVDTHRGHVLKKLRLRNNSDITRFAIQHGLMPV